MGSHAENETAEQDRLRRLRQAKSQPADASLQEVKLRRNDASVTLAVENPPEAVGTQLPGPMQQWMKAIELKSLLHVDVDPTFNNVCAEPTSKPVRIQKSPTIGATLT